MWCRGHLDVKYWVHSRRTHARWAFRSTSAQEPRLIMIPTMGSGRLSEVSRRHLATIADEPCEPHGVDRMGLNRIGFDRQHVPLPWVRGTPP